MDLGSKVMNLLRNYRRLYRIHHVETILISVVYYYTAISTINLIKNDFSLEDVPVWAFFAFSSAVGIYGQMQTHKKYLKVKDHVDKHGFPELLGDKRYEHMLEYYAWESGRMESYKAAKESFTR